MHVKAIKPTAEQNCVEPTLELRIEMECETGREIPLTASCLLYCEDGKFLATLHPCRLGVNSHLLEAEDVGTDRRLSSVMTIWRLTLSQRQLDHLEMLREKNKKGDVVLNCHITTEFLCSRAQLAHLRLTNNAIPDERGIESTVVAYRYDTNYRTNTTNMWILSGDSGRKFLERRTTISQESLLISRSDWIHDYLAPWQATRYVVLELPQPELLTSGHTVQEKINAAIESAESATEARNRGDWNRVIHELRKVWELLRNDADIKALLLGDGYTEEAADALNRSIKEQFNFASKFAHRLDRSGSTMPEIRASKEDAELVYTFAMALINLVARKAQHAMRTS